MEITGRGVVITGGKRIGSDVAVALARRGADVALIYNRSRAEADEAATAITALGRRAFILQADLADPASCGRAIDQAADALGRLDVLVNMASVYERRPLDEVRIDDWSKAVDVDLRATYLCTRAAIPHMRRQHGGRVVNFSDWIAASGRPRYAGYLPYYVAKRGVMGLTEALALELAPEQILVNAVAPGPIIAPPGTRDEEKRDVERATPLGRWGGAGEISKAVLFLVATDFVTGETIRVDGGRHLK
jgi:NAD(P)-dependent dehydrogenase (short-subunit alcohol dehydrogenase family)